MSTGADAPESKTGFPRPGETIDGKYVVEHGIGSGAMGFVVAAKHLGLGTRVAIKFISASVTDDLRARFKREAQLAASVQSEHVARVLDSGTFKGERGEQPYLVMEFLEGRDLSRELRARTRLPLEEAADYVVQVCDGLAEAHARGIVHRDIKPSNIFLSQRASGQLVVKLLDFGISKAPKADADEESLTHTAALLGSPMYMSPEQIRHSKGVDPRTDVWSLGVVLFQLLTGKAPFRGEGTSSTLASVMVDETPSVRALVPELPEEIETLLRRCLDKNPRQRVQSVTEIAHTLAPFASVAGKRLAARLPSAPPPSRAHPSETVTIDERPPIAAADTQSPSVLEPASPWKRRSRVLAGVVVVGLAAMITVPFVLGRSHEPTPTPTQTAPPPAASSITAPSAAATITATTPVASATQPTTTTTTSSASATASATNNKTKTKPKAVPKSTAVPSASSPFGSALDSHD